MVNLVGVVFHKSEFKRSHRKRYNNQLKMILLESHMPGVKRAFICKTWPPLKDVPPHEFVKKMQCHHVFHSSISCPAAAYPFIKNQLQLLLNDLTKQSGVYCHLKRKNGSYRVKISANGTMIVAKLRRPLEKLMNEKMLNHASLTLPVLQLLFSNERKSIMKSLHEQHGTYILFDRHNLCFRIYGEENKVALAEQSLVKSLLALIDNKHKDIPLRGGVMPHDFMKKVVDKFGSRVRLPQKDVS